MAIGSVAVIVLVMTSVIGRDCDNDLIELSIAGLGTEFIAYIPTLYFGWDIIRKLTKKDKI